MATAGVAKAGIVCAGNWIVDIVHTAPYWPTKGDLVRLSGRQIGVGGGAANVMTDLHAFGARLPLAAIGAIGPDTNGDIIRDHCARIGVPTGHLVTLHGSLTAYDEVINIPADSRTFFYHGGANDAFDVAHVPVTALAAQGYKIFYLGYLMLLGALDRRRPDGSTGAADLLAQVRAAGMITCVDMVSDAHPDFRAIVAPALPHCDYVIINEIEAGRAAGLDVRGPDGALLQDRVREAAAILLGDVQRAVIVHAPEGALWAAQGEGPIWAASQPLAPDWIVSPVGAGDAFCAAVLYGIHEDWPPLQTLHIAHLAAKACLAGATATDGIPTLAALMADYTKNQTGGPERPAAKGTL